MGRQGEAWQAAMLHAHCWSSSGTGTSTGSAPPPVPRKSGSGVGLGMQDAPPEHDEDVVWGFLGGPGFNSQLPIQGNLCKGPHGNQGSSLLLPTCRDAPWRSCQPPGPTPEGSLQMEQGEQGALPPQSQLFAASARPWGQMPLPSCALANLSYL